MHKNKLVLKAHKFNVEACSQLYNSENMKNEEKGNPKSTGGPNNLFLNHNQQNSPYTNYKPQKNPFANLP